MLATPLNAAALSAKLLQQAGLIKYDNGVITILDREAIASSACECYEAIQKYTESMRAP
jgi:hypothetical protein